jgi:hypothetical protein
MTTPPAKPDEVEEARRLKTDIEQSAVLLDQAVQAHTQHLATCTTNRDVRGACAGANRLSADRAHEKERIRVITATLVALVERVAGERDALVDRLTRGEWIRLALETECDAAIRKRDEAREWAEKSVREVEARERIMTCVWCGHQAAQHWHSGCSKNPGPKPFKTQECGHCECKRFVRSSKPKEKP